MKITSDKIHKTDTHKNQLNENENETWDKEKPKGEGKHGRKIQDKANEEADTRTEDLFRPFLSEHSGLRSKMPNAKRTDIN